MTTLIHDGDEHREPCPTCGLVPPRPNPHRMDKSKVTVLADIAKLNAKGVPWVKCQEGYALEVDGVKIRSAYRARAHAERLHWFGLLDYNGHRTGEFRVNADGLSFLRGALAVPAWIKCVKGEVVDRAEELVKIADVRGVILDKAYWDGYPESDGA